jgi:hypothetical protein
VSRKFRIESVRLIRRRADAGAFRRLVGFYAIGKVVFWLAEYERGLRLVYLTSRQNADLRGLKYQEAVLIRQAQLWR